MASLLTIAALQNEATVFATAQSKRSERALYGVTDGKAVGTFLEHKFQAHLGSKYLFDRGNAARGIDFPALEVDLKVTSVRQPQSSCPFRSARQKLYGLGYSLLIFVYDKSDDERRRAGRLRINSVIYVEKERTADFQTTSGLARLIQNQANRDDILAFFSERMLPLDEIEAETLADEVLSNPPNIGFLTVSNALQWRLQYGRVIEQAGKVAGVIRLL